MRPYRRSNTAFMACRRTGDNTHCMRFLFTSSTAVLLIAAPAVAQTPPDGAAVFKQSCATCHTAAPADRAPSDRALREMTADAIRTALTIGPMRAQGQALSD